MKILAESSETRFVAFSHKQDEFQLAWDHLTLHFSSDEFEQVQVMFEEVLLDEMLTIFDTEEEDADVYQPDALIPDDNFEEIIDADEVVLWFNDVGLRLSVDDFQELAFLISEAALMATAKPSAQTHTPVTITYNFPPIDTVTFSLN
jgi:hypothetical protein